MDNTNNSGEDDFNVFLDQIIEDKGYRNLDPEVYDQIREEMARALLSQIDRAAINALPEDKAAELSEKLDDPNFTEEDAMQFIKDSGVDVEQVTLTTMLQFRELYLGNIKVTEDTGAEDGE